MRIGPKAGVAAWSGIIAVSCALMALGFDRDSDAPIRDTNIELQLIALGPSSSFIEYCEAMLRRNGSLDGKQQTEWARRLLGDNGDGPSLTKDFAIRSVRWCPFPTATTKVRDALAMVTGATPMTTLHVHSGFLEAVRSAYRAKRDTASLSDQQAAAPRESVRTTSESERVQTSSATKGSDASFISAPVTAVELRSIKFKSLVDELARGARIAAISTVSVASSGSLGGFPCTGDDIIFSENTSKLPDSIRLVVGVITQGGSAGTAYYCIAQADLDPSISLAGTAQTPRERAYGAFFASLIAKNPHYSYSNATNARSPGWNDIGETSRNAAGGRSGTISGGFSFPALTMRLPELGDLSIEDAMRKVRSQIESATDASAIFGVKMPMRLFVCVSLSAIVVLTMMFLMSLHSVGKLALPEVVQDFPGPLRVFICVLALVGLPTGALLFCSKRLLHALPDIASMLPTVAVVWACLALVPLFRLRGRISDDE